MLVLIFLAVLCGIPEQNTVIREYEPYRLLYSQRPGANSPIRDFGYVVSVDSYLDRSEVEKLICRVIQKEKPVDATRVSISVYHKLEKYAPTGGLPNAELRDRLVASYIRNAKLQAAQNTLVLVRDTAGNSLNPPQGYEFDHTKSCP
jgi:hypothetical protein